MASTEDMLTESMLSESMLDMGYDRAIEEEQKALAAKAQESQKSTMLTISFILMVIVGLGNKIFQILQFIPMRNYPLFLSIYTTMVYIPVSYLYIFPMLKWGSNITPEQTQIPKKTFFYMGLLDAIAGIMQTISIKYIANGTLVILLTQTAIPISMAISSIILGTKYKMFHYIGCVIVAAGLAVVLVPKFLNPSDDADEASLTTMLFSIAVLIAANIPQCLSSVVKEKALGDALIDPIYLNGWISIFQFLMSFPLLIPAAPAADVAIPDIMQNLIDGAKCYVGINTYVRPDNLLTSVTNALPLSDTIFSSDAAYIALTTTLNVFGLSDDKKSDECEMAPYYVNIYILFNIFYNILIIMILKYGSSNIFYLAMTVMVPLGSITFSFKFIPKNKPLASTDIIGLIVILFGLVIYRFWDGFISLFRKNEEVWAEAEPLTLNNDDSSY